MVVINKSANNHGDEIWEMGLRAHCKVVGRMECRG